MMRTKDIADAIKHRVTAREAAEAIGLQPNKNGYCKCPLHGEKTGSMKLYPGSRGWYCFGCHQGGDVIRLVMEINGLSFMESVQWINDTFNLCVDLPTQATDGELAQVSTLQKMRNAWLVSYELATKLYVKIMEAGLVEQIPDSNELLDNCEAMIEKLS